MACFIIANGGLLHGPPPLHPILVNFTAALVPVSLVCDLLSRWTGRESLRAAGWWTLCFGALITPFTAAAGWFWLRQMGGMDMREMDIHSWLGTALAVALLPLAVWRWSFHSRGTAPGGLYLTVTSVVLLSLVLQGHIGGKLSFGAANNSEGHDHGGREMRERTGATQPTAPPHQNHDGIEWKDAVPVKQ